jgi:hypothetical protein
MSNDSSSAVWCHLLGVGHWKQACPCGDLYQKFRSLNYVREGLFASKARREFLHEWGIVKGVFYSLRSYGSVRRTVFRM